MKRLLAISLFAQTASAELPETVDFNDHVQPILSENCYHCHGPDSTTRAPKKNPLRLDREEYAFEARSNGKATIIKGDPDASELVKRIITADPDDVMPPSESHKAPLKPGQIALLKKWIEQGAPYEEHWSFIPPVRPKNHQSIDAFIQAKQKELHLSQNPSAELHRLIRRLTFDLTGLPPTPAEVDAFKTLASGDLATAIQSSTERLLKSRAYAEHFGRHWLDAARYADTHGIHIDNYRSIWPYRDWVIEAFRQNMPFDQFTIEQIAGDLLPKRTLEQHIASGFNRCLPTTGEGGAIAEEYEAIYAKDRVETTSAIWLGLTTGCAACHDHKFDPISQKDFYSMTAFFRNSTMPAMDRNSAEHPPVIFAPLPNDRKLWKLLDKDLASIEQALTKRQKEARPDFDTWVSTQGSTPVENPTVEPAVALPLLVSDGKFSGTIQGREKTWDFKGGTTNSPVGKVVNLADTNTDLGQIAAFNSRDQITMGGFLRVDGSANGPIISKMNTGRDYRGWDLWLEGGRIGAHIVDKWPDLAIKAVTKSPIARNKWLHVMLTYNGRAEPSKSLTVYVDGKVQPINYSHKGKVGSLLTEVPTRLGARHPDSKLKGVAAMHNFQFHKRLLTPDEIKQAASNTNVNQLLAIAPAKRSKPQNETIFQFYLDKIDAPTRALKAQKSPLLTKKNQLRSRGSVTLVMEEKKEPAFAHILERGEYTLKKEKVSAAIPELFQGSDYPDGKQSRKQLATWLVSKENPLTARVTVNRLWYYFFGRGLVETTEDFGIMGARPSHPELLDFLAMEFMDSGWDMQHLIKLITASKVYQQSAQVTSQHREKDPTNLFLARSPRHRLEAEQIRDLALATSKLLIDKAGGPPAKPYQPEGIWEAVAMNQSNTRYYKPDKGDGLYRRSVYTFWKRTAAPPSMEILNAPTREVFCVRRDRTNTPLQAFVTLNDTQFIESSRELASRALKSTPAPMERLDFIARALLSRPFKEDEKSIITEALNHHLKRYREDPDLATQLISVGESKADASLQASELAAWTLIASQIFNLDETLTK